MSNTAIRPTPAITPIEDIESKKPEYAHNEQAYEKEDVVVENVVDHYAAGYTDNSLEIDDAENKRLRRLINTRILPIMCVVYLTQALDKGALGPISIMGWLEDINAQGQDYALTSTVMWVGIMVGEPIAAQLIRRLPVAKLLVASMAIWTALCYWLAFSKNVPHILANRALMGFFEATFNPCLVTITVQWYKKEEQPIISAIWQSMFAFGTTVQSVVAYGMYNVRDTSLRNWQWVVLIFAMLSTIGTVVTYFCLPDSPTKTRWASEELKVKFVERVRSNNQGLSNKKWKSDQAWEALKDPMVYALFLFAFLQTNVIGGLSKFNSLLINRAFGFDVLTSQLLKIPMSLCSVAFYMLMAFLIHKFNNTLYAMIGYCVINATGTIVLCAVAPSESTKVGLFIAFILMQAIAAVNTAIFLMMSRNIAGQTKKSLVYGSTFAAWGAGNATAPQLFWNDWAPRYLPSLYIHLGIYAVFIMLCLAVRVMLVRRNKAKIAAQEGMDVRNLHAFEDLTDLQNPDFRYCL